MSSFEPAVAVVLAHEGTDTNYWVDDGDDPGGETVWGWSMLTIMKLKLSPRDLGLEQDRFTPGCLKAVSKATCAELYRKYFWELYGYERLVDQVVATKVMDAAVNMSPHTAHCLAQRAAGVAEDGILGPMSVQAINTLEPRVFVAAYSMTLSNHYRAIASARPRSMKFLSTWLKRANWGL
jgi:lysozyme family protein